jgi:signal transduction histidine kinase
MEIKEEKIITLLVDNEEDLVEIRDATRKICEAIGIKQTDQVKVITAVSEITRNIYEYADKGYITFSLFTDGLQKYLKIVAKDEGPGIEDVDRILNGKFKSKTGMGIGLKGSKSLMDSFVIDSEPGAGVTITMSKIIERGFELNREQLENLKEALLDTSESEKVTIVAELEAQNQELVNILEELNKSYKELEEKKNLLDKLNKELNNALELVNKKNVELKAFNYTISHDLKAPLRGISGYAREITRKHAEPLSERGKFCVEQIIQASKQMEDLIEDLLSYSRVETEAINKTPVNLKKLIETIINQRKPTIEEKGAKLSFVCPEVEYECWESGMVHVFSNLIDNAIKFSSKSDPPEIDIRVYTEKNNLIFSIKDNGVGFDMKYHDRMFELFQRLVRYDEFEGTGAGLAIVKKIVEKHDGRVWAESEPGKGARFYVSLPL